MKRNNKEAKIRLVAHDGRHCHMFIKDPSHRRCLAPLGQIKGTVQAENIEIPEDAAHIFISKDQEKKWKRWLKAADKSELQEACNLWCQIWEMFQNPSPACHLVLLSMLARVCDIAMPELPGIPVISLKNRFTPTESLRLLLLTVNGADCVKKKGRFYVRRPSTLSPIVPLGRTAPSEDLCSYLGGYTRLGYSGKERRFWVPLVCKAIVICPNVPMSVINRTIDSSPLAIPIFLGTNKKQQGRPVISLDGSTLDSYDPEMLQTLIQNIPIVHAELEIFIRWLTSRKKRIRIWQEEVETFFPTARRGRFVQKIDTEEIRIKAVALSLFKQWLMFCCEVTGWISLDTANAALFSAWGMILPESAPAAEGGASECVKWNDPDTFWSFLSKYMEEQKGSLATSGVPHTASTIATLRKLPEGMHLIFPRAALLAAYEEWLVEHGGETPPKEKYWETKAQKLISGWGVQLKTEGSDVTWRFSFYDKGEAPAGVNEKLACLAFPLQQLPDSIQKILKKRFESMSDTALNLREAATDSEPKNVLKRREN